MRDTALATASELPPADDRSPAHSEILHYLFLVRRFWWAALGAGLIGAGAAWYAAETAEPTYTAEALLQKRATSPLAAAGLATSRHEPLDFGSEIEIIRSRSVLADVIMPLGLQLSLLDRPQDRTRIIGDVEIAPRIASMTFELTLREGRIQLRSPERGSIVASARPDEWLALPGFRLRVRDVRSLERGPIRIRVSDHQHTLEQLQNRLVVEPGKGVDLLHVRYRDPDPVHAANVVNAVAQSYTAFRARIARDAAGTRRHFLEGRLAALSDSLRRAQEALLDYQERERLLDPTMQRDIIVTGLAQIESEARDLRFQERILMSLVDALDSSSLTAAGLTRVVALGRDVMPGGVELYNRLRELETERNRLTASRFGYTEAGPEVEVVDSLIQVTRAEIRTLAQQNLRMLRERRLEVETRQQEIQREVGEIPQRTTELARLQQQVTAVQNMFELLLGRYYEAQIAEAIQAGDVEVVDAASVPMRPDPAHRELKAGIGFLGGVFLVLALLGLVHNADNRVRSRQDAESAARLPIVGLVPHIPARSRDHAVERLAGVESFRAIGIHITYSRPDHPKVITITSAGPGESKSTVAANLAVAMAKQGAHVLLVDADLRRPVVHRIFNCKRSPGLTDVIDGSVSPEEAAIHDEVFGLDLLPCGTLGKNPPALLTSMAFTQLLDRLRGRYDNIILDTAPLLAVADSSVVCARADGTILVIRANRTTRSALRQAMELLNRVRAPLIGTVLADIPPYGAYARSMYGYEAYHEYYASQAGPGNNRRKAPRLLQKRA